MTTKRLRGTYCIFYIICYWRGPTALSVLCDVGNAKAFGSRMGERTDTYAIFHVYMSANERQIPAESVVFIGKKENL